MRIALVLLCLVAVAFRPGLERSDISGPGLGGPDKPAYRLYTSTLKTTTYKKLLRRTTEADVVLFGELHNNPICHWLELQLTKDLQTAKKGQVVLGAEMFETDNQVALSDYVEGRTTSKELAANARLWPNFDTDYKPITDFAREQHIPFVATNVPHPYARLVSRRGLSALDTLSIEAKRQMAPLPLTVDLTLPGYKAMMDMMGGSPASGGSALRSSHGGSASHSTTNPHGTNTDMAANFARAQAIKDATMAHFILKHLKPGQTLLHFNGDYHSKNFEGIVWYLRQQRPDLNIVTLSSVELADSEHPASENRNLADFVLAIPADMTKTY